MLGGSIGQISEDIRASTSGRVRVGIGVVVMACGGHGLNAGEEEWVRGELQSWISWNLISSTSVPITSSGVDAFTWMPWTHIEELSQAEPTLGAVIVMCEFAKTLEVPIPKTGCVG
jgi:hypothetical protein